MPFWFYPAAFAAKWAIARFVQHGVDPEATWKALENDVTKVFETGVGVAKKGVTIAGDATAITTAIFSLRTAADLQSLIDGTHALTRALQHLPDETLAGLQKSIKLDERIDAALASGMNQCGIRLLEKKPEEGEAGITILQRVYFGLYLIGRSENAIDAEAASACIRNLIALHRQTSSEAEKIEHALNGVVMNDITNMLELGDGHMHINALLPAELQDSTLIYVLAGMGAEIAPAKRPLLADILLFPKTV